MSPIEPCPNCRKKRHRWKEEPLSQLCMECRLGIISNTNYVFGPDENPLVLPDGEEKDERT